ncbi:hypothetical protein MLD38_010768 [Melastoma candidum]|uniref:Uncharacterized protein n=1 Tax=Melastoma candidum TaxID=119954 RepID=A0ACB9R0X1_9MYRT|nr:hypothetical protein MLD38_010768 [Melastoma candidum]
MKVVTECLLNVDVANILEPNCPGVLIRSNAKQSDRGFISLEDNHSLSRPPLTRTSELWCRIDNYALSYVWANNKDVQEALHVRMGTKLSWARCNKTLSYTKDVPSVVGYQANLTRNSLVALVYSGDHDMAVPYLGTLRWIELLNLTVESEWRPWFVDGQVAGFTTRNEKFPYYLSYATIKGGGHTAPEYRPKECFAMAERQSRANPEDAVGDPWASAVGLVLSRKCISAATAIVT